MATESEIDDLLRQDEAELKEKRKRLRAFATALEDMRGAQTKAKEAADALIDKGDVTRAELTRVFKLSRAERGLTARPRTASNKSTAGSANDRADKPSASGNDTAPKDRDRGEQAAK